MAEREGLKDPAIVEGDGVLVVDKPAGPTSHDVVARMRRVLGERRIGHTGTLDPAATGVLPLVVGRATRLARFMSASDKSYDAVVRLGFATDTYDAAGRPVGRMFAGTWPTRDAVESALGLFRGTFLQQPPAYSAKKVGGKRSYKRAAAHRRLTPRESLDPSEPLEPLSLPAPAPVSTSHLVVEHVEGDRVTLTVTCSAGFYVRSLAHDLGVRLGTGAHLVSLRRTRSGDFTLDSAIGLEAAERDPSAARAALVPLDRMLRGLPHLVLAPEGVVHAVQGRYLVPADIIGDAFVVMDRPGPNNGSGSAGQTWVRLLDGAGRLVALARPSGPRGPLHPTVVLM